jgi:hypothetical protein
VTYEDRRGAPRYRCRYRPRPAGDDSASVLSASTPPRVDTPARVTVRPMHLNAARIDDLIGTARFDAEAETALLTLLGISDHQEGR